MRARLQAWRRARWERRIERIIARRCALENKLLDLASRQGGAEGKPGRPFPDYVKDHPEYRKYL